MDCSLCFLFGAGEYDGIMPVTPESGDYVIAVDGGLDYLMQTDIPPNLIIGDFDSVTSGRPGKNPGICPAMDYEVLSFPPKKDYTDMQLGVKEGIRRGYNTFIIYGGLGGRIDHSLANIQMLSWLSGQGFSGFLIGGNQVITTITDSTFRIKADTAYAHRIDPLFAPIPDRYISIFSHGNISEGVTIRGLRYEADSITLTNVFALGTSNNYTGSDYSISVKNGTLIIVSELA